MGVNRLEIKMDKVMRDLIISSMSGAFKRLGIATEQAMQILMRRQPFTIGQIGSNNEQGGQNDTGRIEPTNDSVGGEGSN